MNFSEGFSVINPGCGCARFAVPTATHERWLRTHENWHCPHCGQVRHFTGRSAEAKRIEELEREVVRAQAEANRKAQEAKESRQQNKRIIKRIKAGVCPCCTRTFQNLARHMAGEHPEIRKLFIGNESRPACWRDAVDMALQTCGGRATLSQLYACIEGNRPSDNPWWREKVRQVAGQHFHRIKPGEYALPAAA